MGIFNWLIATETGEVGVSWFDFYSIGHICMGVGIFLCISLFYTIPKSKGKTPLFSLLFVWILTLIALVVWEILENIVFLQIGLKFEGRMDSTQNIITDILIGAIAGLGAWLFAYMTFEKDRKVWPYYIVGLISFALWLCIFIILRYITFANSPIFT